MYCLRNNQLTQIFCWVRQSLRTVSDQTKHESMVIIPIIKHGGHLGWVVCHMAGHLGNQIAKKLVLYYSKQCSL